MISLVLLTDGKSVSSLFVWFEVSRVGAATRSLDGTPITGQSSSVQTLKVKCDSFTPMQYKNYKAFTSEHETGLHQNYVLYLLLYWLSLYEATKMQSECRSKKERAFLF